MSYFAKKRLRAVIAVAIAVVVFVAASYQLNLSWWTIIRDFPRAINAFTRNYLPIDFSQFGRVLATLSSTILTALTGAIVGMFLAFFGALAVSVKTSRAKAVQVLVRFVASVTRNIPEGIWGIILYLCFWYGDFIGFLVMAILSFGFLTRVFSDTIDETGISSIEALEACGASYWQIIFLAVVPETLPALVSWALYAIENNIRSSTIVGMLTGSGIGFLMYVYVGGGLMDAKLLMASIVTITVVIVVVDQISGQIRRVLNR